VRCGGPGRDKERGGSRWWRRCGGEDHGLTRHACSVAFQRGRGKRRWGRAEGVRAKMGAELLGPAVERKDGPEGREVDWGWFGPEGKQREGKPGKVG
jgi:hypothetical protein